MQKKTKMIIIAVMAGAAVVYGIWLYRRRTIAYGALATVGSAPTKTYTVNIYSVTYPGGTVQYSIPYYTSTAEHAKYFTAATSYKSVDDTISKFKSAAIKNPKVIPATVGVGYKFIRSQTIVISPTITNPKIIK